MIDRYPLRTMGIQQYERMEDILTSIREQTEADPSWTSPIREVASDEYAASIAAFDEGGEQGISIFLMRQDDDRAYSLHAWFDPDTAYELLSALEHAVSDLGVHRRDKKRRASHGS